LLAATTTRRRFAGAAVATIAAGACAAALGGCGIPAQSSAQPVGGDLANRVLTPSTSSTLPKTIGTPVTVYFIKTGKLVPRPRDVPLHDKALPEVMAALLAGPTTRETVATIGTALGYDSQTLASPPRRTRGEVIIDFSPSSSPNFGQLSGTTLKLGVAQVVCSVAALYPKDGVQFQLGGGTIEVPTETGAVASKPVHASQYASLVASGSTCGAAP